MKGAAMAKLSNKELKNIFLRNWGAHEDSCCECDGCKLYDHITALEKEFDDLSGHDRKASALVVEFARAQQKTEADNAALRDGLEELVEAAKGASKCWTCSANANKCHQAHMIDKSCEFAKWEQALAAARKLLEKS